MTPSHPLPRVTVSQNGRFLVTEHGEPFFWLGDTAWELFHRLTREEAEYYFANREAKRFTVIQAVALAEIDGLNTPNREGQRPLVDNDPTRPNEAYFALVDAFIRMAADHNLYIGLLPTWGDKIAHMWGAGPIVFNPENAYQYGLFLGKRYRDQSNVIWIFGGDRPVEYRGIDEQDHNDIDVYRAMARGVREGLGSLPALFTYHPNGDKSTSLWLHNEDWLDMNMMQSGHGGGHDVPVWEKVAHDYGLSPAKPVLDGEPNYEDHPVSPWPVWDPANGYYRDHDVRKQCYRSVFAGACGVTYGHHSVWQMVDASREPINHPDRDWKSALDRPGASQMQHLRALMESRPYLTRIPDQAMIVSDPGESGEHVQATRDVDGSYGFVYFPLSRTVALDLTCMKSARVKAQWYDPRTGEIHPAGHRPAGDAVEFTPPAGGPDWVLMLDRG